MFYDLIIEIRYGGTSYRHNIGTWKEVKDILKSQLQTNVIDVRIHKYSSDNRELGYKRVTMANFYSVISSETDKILD